MSSFASAAALQLLNFSARAWSQDCVLCLARSGTDLVCEGCAAELPASDAACPGCALPLPADGTCGGCRAHPFAFDAAVARFEYRFPVDRLIRRFKYAGDLAVGRWLANRLAERVAGAERPDLLVAPPLSRERLRERGFNQALEVARHLGRRLGVRLDVDGMRRVRETPSQAGLGRRERHANLRHAFDCALALEERHVAIVDDVLTTGATADALARVLKSRGARRVSVWAVARAPQPGAR